MVPNPTPPDRLAKPCRDHQSFTPLPGRFAGMLTQYPYGAYPLGTSALGVLTQTPAVGRLAKSIGRPDLYVIELNKP